MRDLTTTEWLRRLDELQGINMSWFRATRASRLPELGLAVIARPAGTAISCNPASETPCLAWETCGVS
jgi:hypothetical protein